MPILSSTSVRNYGTSTEEPPESKGILQQLKNFAIMCFTPPYDPPKAPIRREWSPAPIDPFFEKFYKKYHIVDAATNRCNGFWILERATLPFTSMICSDIHPDTLREKLKTYISENADKYSLDGMYFNRKNKLVPFEEYLETLKKPDELIYRALSEVYERPVHVFSPELPDFVVFGVEFDAEPIRIICNNKRCQAVFKRALTRS